MTIIDISRTLWPEVATWPGDTHFGLTTTLDRAKGHSVNLTTITMSAHTGSHVDAPRHYTDEGLTMERVDLRPFWGLTQVVTIDKAPGPLFPQDFIDYDLSLAPRLLVHTPASSYDPTLFPHNILYPSPTLANYLGSLDIILFGSDAPSMDKTDDPHLPGHNALLRNNIAILEGLDLTPAPDGLYELVALPLKIQDGDGSPVRAALRPI